MKTPTRIIILLIAVVFTLCLAAPALAATSLNGYENQLLALINKERAKRGLAQLRVNTRLVASARAHSADMGAQKYFGHDSPSGESWGSRIIRHGYTNQGCKYWKAGENIAWGKGLYSSPVCVVDAWMKSTMHRTVILTKVFRDIGVGAVKTDGGFDNLDGTVWFFTLDVGRRITQ